MVTHKINHTKDILMKFAQLVVFIDTFKKHKTKSKKLQNSSFGELCSLVAWFRRWLGLGAHSIDLPRDPTQLLTRYRQPVVQSPKTQCHSLKTRYGWMIKGRPTRRQVRVYLFWMKTKGGGSHSYQHLHHNNSHFRLMLLLQPDQVT